MTTTLISTTCATCRLTFDVPSTNLVLALPAATADPTEQPSFVHSCAGCGACDDVRVSWRTAAYLLDAGVTTITAPSAADIVPSYPERRPAITTAMTLDDLIDLHLALDTHIPTR